MLGFINVISKHPNPRVVPIEICHSNQRLHVHVENLPISLERISNGYLHASRLFIGKDTVLRIPRRQHDVTNVIHD